MHGEISTQINVLPPFKYFCSTIGELPSSYLESMTYYETAVWLCNYLKETIIPTVNNTGNAVTELQNLYLQLQSYVNNYFDNLDVQEEINIKLDNMASDGSLTNLLKAYIDPLYTAYENSINNELDSFETNVNNSINDIRNQVLSVASGSPLVASSTAGMTNTSRIYVNTSDGKWYYYDGDSWEIGGTYQSTGIGENTVGLENLKPEVIKERYGSILGNAFDPFNVIDKKGITDADGTIVDNESSFITGKIHLLEGEKIRFYVNTDSGYLNNASSEVLKICSYQNDDTFIAKTSNYYYTAPQDCYIRVMFRYSDISFSNRFKLMAQIYPADYTWNNSLRKVFIPHTTTDKNTINLNVEENELDSSLRQKLYINDTPSWEIGSYYSSTGYKYDGNTHAIRTVLYLKIAKNTEISIDESALFTIIFYDDSLGYITHETNSATGWVNKYKFTADSYVAIVLKYVDEREIQSADINTLANLLTITDSIEVCYNYISDNIPEGTPLAYSGEKINIDNKCYVSNNIGISTLGQDGCAFNGKVFEFDDNGTFKVSDIATATNYGTFYLDQYQSIVPHCNSACFGNEYYDENDPYPLLYINAYNTPGLPQGTCYVHRILVENDSYSTQLLQTIKIGFTDDEIWSQTGDARPYGNFAVDTDHNYLYVFNIRDVLKVVRFFKFKLPTLSQGENVTLSIDDILDYFDVQYEKYIQGCEYYQNKIYSACGINSLEANSSSIRVIDLGSKAEVTYIPTSSIANEPETLTFSNGKMLFGGTQLRFINFQ